MHEVYSCDLQGKQSPCIKSGNNLFLVWKLNEEKKSLRTRVEKLHGI